MMGDNELIAVDARPMGDDECAVSVGEIRDPDELGDTTAPGCKHVAAARFQEQSKAPLGRLTFTGRYPHPLGPDAATQRTPLIMWHRCLLDPLELVSWAAIANRVE